MTARRRMLAVALGTMLAVMLAGCWGYVRVRPAAVVVYDAPPPVRVVAQPPAPYVGAVWVAGYWSWNGATWVWMDGRYEQPRVGYVFVQPRWVRHGRGWVHVEGGWHPHGHGRVEVRGRGHGTVRVR